MHIETPQLVVFDLDGTLVDSSQDIAIAFIHGLRAGGMPEDAITRFEPLIASRIGNPLKAMFAEALGSDDDVHLETMCQAYREYYFEHCADHTDVFPGVIDCLDRLAEIPLAIATTKKTFQAEGLLTRLGLAHRFSLIQGTDGFSPKPDPAILFRVTDALGIQPEHSWMVGDTPHDILAARRAGMFSCAVTTGTASRKTLMAAQPTLVVDTLADLGQILKSGR